MSSASSLHKDHPGLRITKKSVSLLSINCSAKIDDDSTTFPCLTKLNVAFLIISNMVLGYILSNYFYVCFLEANFYDYYTVVPRD